MSEPYNLMNINTGEAKMLEVTLQIDSERCADIIHYFVNQQIPFKISHLTLLSKMTGEPQAIQVEQAVELSKTNSKKELVKKAYEKYIINGIKNVPPTLEEIAAELELNVAGFKNLFRKIYGQPFYQLYMEKKMEYAAKLLRQGHSSVEVSKRIGYAHSIKFNKMFQKHFGITPKKYQLEKMK